MIDMKKNWNHENNNNFIKLYMYIYIVYYIDLK